MENRYWIGRQRSAMAMARTADTGEARLIHYDLAGRYSIKAAQCLPFSQPGAAASGERAVLHLRDPASRATPCCDPQPRLRGWEFPGVAQAR